MPLNGISESEVRHCLRGHVQEPLAAFGRNLMEGTKIQYSFVVRDPEEKDLEIGYKILDTETAVVVSRDRVKFDEGIVVVTKPGAYTLEFDNSFSWFTEKNIALCYEIVPLGCEFPVMESRFLMLARQYGIEAGGSSI